VTITLKGVPEGETATVSIDGEQLSAAAVGLPRAVDPGHHAVVVETATAEGKQEIDIKEAEQKPIEVALVVVRTAPATASVEPNDKEPEQPLSKHTSHGPTLLTWSAIGLGVVGVAVGTVTGVLSMSKKSSLAKECENDVCGPSSYADYNAANSLATISTIAFSVTGACAVVAVVTLGVGHNASTSPAPAAQAASRVTVTPWVGLGGGGVSGTF
jgi:hypothetical protein